MFDLIGIILLFIVNIFPQQFSLQITRPLRIEFVELLHYLMYKKNRLRFSLRVYCNIAWKEQKSTARDEVEYVL